MSNPSSPSSHPAGSPSPSPANVNALGLTNAFPPAPSSYSSYPTIDAAQSAASSSYIPASPHPPPPFSFPLVRPYFAPMPPPTAYYPFPSIPGADIKPILRHVQENHAIFEDLEAKGETKDELGLGGGESRYPPSAVAQQRPRLSPGPISSSVPPHTTPHAHPAPWQLPSQGAYMATSSSLRPGLNTMPFSIFHDPPLRLSLPPSGSGWNHGDTQMRPQSPLPRLYRPPARSDPNLHPSVFPSLPPLPTLAGPSQSRRIRPPLSPSLTMPMQYPVASASTLDILGVPPPTANTRTQSQTRNPKRSRKRARRPSPPLFVTAPPDSGDEEEAEEDETEAEGDGLVNSKPEHPAIRYPGRLPREARLKIAEKIVEAGTQSVNVDELIELTGLTGQQIRSQLHRKRRNLRAQLMRLIQQIE